MQNLKVFLFSYNYEGAQYSLEIPANDAEEAKQRLSRMAFAKYDGELKHKIPTAPGAGVSVRLITWLRNRIG